MIPRIVSHHPLVIGNNGGEGGGGGGDDDLNGSQVLIAMVGQVFVNLPLGERALPGDLIVAGTVLISPHAISS